MLVVYDVYGIVLPTLQDIKWWPFPWFSHGFSKVSAGELSRGGDPAKALERKFLVGDQPLEDWENTGRFPAQNREKF